MIKALEAILLSSENPRKLAEFYRDKVGLTITQEMKMGDQGEEGFSFEKIGGSNLYILHHSKVKGMNSQPERMMFNFEVDNIESDVKRLDEKGVKKIQDTYHVEEYGLIATYEDVDGNYFQLVQVKETN